MLKFQTCVKKPSVSNVAIRPRLKPKQILGLLLFVYTDVFVVCPTLWPKPNEICLFKVSLGVSVKTFCMVNSGITQRFGAN